MIKRVNKLSLANAFGSVLALGLACMAVPDGAQAHQVAATEHRLDIIEKPNHCYHLKWTGPESDMTVVFPSDYRDVATTPGGERVVQCERTLSGRELSIEGFNSVKREVLVRTVLLNGHVQVEILSGDRNSFTLLFTPSAWQVAGTYFGLGVEHILGGIDHLLFVLGLILILTGWRQLAFAITAFTVAHSITLALATFEVVRVPQAPVEAVIALSILFLATEYAHQLRGTKGWTSRRPWLVSFSVGLLHGLGFANALSEVGLPQAEVPLALLTFNVGVEVGQLAFVGVVLSLFFVVSRLLKQVPIWIKVAASFCIGSVAAFWFIQRLAYLFAKMNS